MPKTSMNIWGKQFKLDIIYDVYEDEKILPIQEEALKKITSNSKAIDATLPRVKKYCLESELIGNVTAIDNIFNYVKPKALYIKRSKTSRIAALICDYKLDTDHGMAIVFKNEKFSEIGSQDIIA